MPQRAPQGLDRFTMLASASVFVICLGITGKYQKVARESKRSPPFCISKAGQQIGKKSGVPFTLHPQKRSLVLHRAANFFAALVLPSYAQVFEKSERVWDQRSLRRVWPNPWSVLMLRMLRIEHRQNALPSPARFANGKVLFDYRHH